MSGPKTSIYTLTPEQRRQLAEQRKVERRKAVASENIKRNIRNLLQIGNLYSSETAISNELKNRLGDDGGFAEKAEELKSIISQSSIIAENTNADDVEALEEAAKKLADNLAKAEKIKDELSLISATNEKELKLELNKEIDKGFSTSFVDLQISEQEDIDQIKKEILSHIEQMKNRANLSVELIGELENAISTLETINDKVFLKNYHSVSISPLLKKCKLFLDDFEKCHEEFETLFSEYSALCNLYYYVVQDYPCTPASIEKLKSEIERIKESVDEDDEQAYISDCLDEVMEEMGYSVIGSREVTKKNGKHFKNELYHYGEGTVVNVTYSSDGKIAMELGGIDTEDRLPDKHESETLCDSMEHFCEDFKEIEKRLLAKGVILANRISLFPPSTEYAQIINTTDYQITEKTETLQTKKQNRTATKRKALRRE